MRRDNVQAGDMRLMNSEEDQLVNIEPAFPESTVQALEARMNQVKRSTNMARVEAILIRPDTDEPKAGSDPRGGARVGYYPN